MTLRLTDTYGPDDERAKLLPFLLQAARSGTELSMSPGEQRVTFVHVDDVVDAILLALVTPGLTGEVWNVGSGEVVTVRDCLERIEALTGKQGLVLYGARPYIAREIFRYESEVERTYVGGQLVHAPQ